MSIFKRKAKEPTLIDQLIDECMNEMLTMTSGSKDYTEALDNLKDLYKLRDLEKSRKKVSPDVLAGIFGNIFMGGMIIGHERAHAITTKAFSLLTKPKI